MVFANNCNIRSAVVGYCFRHQGAQRPAGVYRRDPLPMYGVYRFPTWQGRHFFCFAIEGVDWRLGECEFLVEGRLVSIGPKGGVGDVLANEKRKAGSSEERRESDGSFLTCVNSVPGVWMMS